MNNITTFEALCTIISWLIFQIWIKSISVEAGWPSRRKYNKDVFFRVLVLVVVLLEDHADRNLLESGNRHTDYRLRHTVDMFIAIEMNRLIRVLSYLWLKVFLMLYNENSLNRPLPDDCRKCKCKCIVWIISIFRCLGYIVHILW